jgi:A/G-specific adenine glycosylase
LLRWYRKAARDLPWRRTSDPYAIWVSEIMLQQTTVAAVIPYWERFLVRFPDVAALASSREEDVLAAVDRAGLLPAGALASAGALAVMERHDGNVPTGFDELLNLPGIGRYTAGAISSVAFGRETPVVDGTSSACSRACSLSTDRMRGIGRSRSV